MNKEQHAKSDFERLIAQYPGLFRSAVDAFDEINKIGSIKLATEEVEKRLTAAQDEVKKLESSLASRQVEAEHLIAARQEQAAHIEAENVRKRDEAIRAANSESAKIIAAAKVEAKQVTVESANEREAVQSEIAKLHVTIDGLTAQIAEKETDLAHAQAQLERTQALQLEIEGHLANARAKLVA